MYSIIHIDESYFIQRKHSVHTMWPRNNNTHSDLKFSKHPRSPFVLSRLQILLTLRLPNCFQISSRGPVTSKLAPSGFQNVPQSDTKSIKYPSLIQSKADSDFGHLMTFPFHQISLDLIAEMPSKCVKF